MIAEAGEPGASVASVARKHGVNANLLFNWMRLDEQGALQGRSRRTPRLLEVSVTPDEAPRTPRPMPATSAAPSQQTLEIVFPDGTRVRASACVPTDQLERVLQLLRR
jgi:transposase